MKIPVVINLVWYQSKLYQFKPLHSLVSFKIFLTTYYNQKIFYELLKCTLKVFPIRILNKVFEENIMIIIIYYIFLF